MRVDAESPLASSRAYLHTTPPSVASSGGECEHTPTPVAHNRHIDRHAYECSPLSMRQTPAPPQSSCRLMCSPPRHTRTCARLACALNSSIDTSPFASAAIVRKQPQYGLHETAGTEASQTNAPSRLTADCWWCCSAAGSPNREIQNFTLTVVFFRHKLLGVTSLLVWAVPQWSVCGGCVTPGWPRACVAVFL